MDNLADKYKSPPVMFMALLFKFISYKDLFNIMNDLRIIYMGTPEFAVPPLKKLIEHDFKVVAVITAPDKPKGRGQKIGTSPVKDYAESQGLPILQPTNLKDPDFLEQLASYNANLQVVVAFRMLPEVVWNM